MKKIDVDKDFKRSKFLIVAMVAQVVVVLLVLFIYLAWL
ncbi:flagellar basal body-associated protein FliL [Roseovarius sp. MBR-51]